MIRLGMIGAGFVAKFHCQALSQVRGVELAGVTALAGAEALSKHAQELGIGPATVYPNVAELAKNVDAVAIYVPNFARLEVTQQLVAAAKAGAKLKGVICEKPLARNLAEAMKMVQLVESAGLRTAYFENQIYMGPVTKALNQLEPVQKAMGPLALVSSAEEHGGPHEPWFWDPTKQGGGVLCDMGCHSIAVSWYALTPLGKPPDFLQPVSVSATTALLKWGLPEWRKKLLDERGVDYGKTAAEDFATGIVTFRNPETGQRVMARFTNSWMFEMQGLRLQMEGQGPGYAFEVNTLQSPLRVFISDVAAEAVADKEAALEKATASRGLLTVQPNEADLYGYTDENIDAASAFEAGKDGMLSWRYGLEVTRLVMASYLAAETGKIVDLTDAGVQKQLETYVPLIQQGRGGEVLQVQG